MDRMNRMKWKGSYRRHIVERVIIRGMKGWLSTNDVSSQIKCFGLPFLTSKGISYSPEERLYIVLRSSYSCCCTFVQSRLRHQRHEEIMRSQLLSVKLTAVDHGVLSGWNGKPVYFEQEFWWWENSERMRWVYRMMMKINVEHDVISGWSQRKCLAMKMMRLRETEVLHARQRGKVSHAAQQTRLDCRQLLR